MNALVCALALFALAAPPPGVAQKKKKASERKDASAIVVDELADGTDLVVARLPGERLSMRLVIRSGGDDDPPGKAGLAHLLEHLVFHGTYEEPEGVLFERAWGAGANLNAYTSSNWTTYVLDAQRNDLDTLVPSFLTMVTSPALPFSAWERERGVVGAEDADRPSEMSLLFAFDQLAFPSANGGITVIGTEESRARITLDDIEAFHATHYVPDNAVLVVTGDVTVDAVRAAAERGLRWMPKLAPPEKQGAETPNVPSQAKAQSYLTVTVHGRLVDGAHPGAAEAAAGLLELRLRKRVIADEQMIATVGAVPHRQRGHEFLILYVVTTSPESSLVPDWLREVVRDAARTPATPQERALVERRHELQSAATRAEPEALADAIMFALAFDDLTPAQAVTRVTRPTPPAWKDVPRMLTKAARDDALVELHFSRFED